MLEGWYGKIIGAILGFIVGRGFLGAIVGLVLGHQFDAAGKRALGRRNGTGQAPAWRYVHFAARLFRGHVPDHGPRGQERRPRHRARDRRRPRGHAALLAGRSRSRCAPSSCSPPESRRIFRSRTTLANLRQLAGNQPDLYRLFVQIQLEAGIQGNGLGDRPRAVLQRICRVLGVSSLEFASLEAMLRMHAGSYGYGAGGRSSSQGAGSAQQSGARLADAYEVLGVPASAADAAVTKAFRRLMSQNHPDKLVAQGLPESMIAAAHERTQRILEAYELVKNHRGIK